MKKTHLGTHKLIVLFPCVLYSHGWHRDSTHIPAWVAASKDSQQSTLIQTQATQAVLSLLCPTHVPNSMVSNAVM